MRSAVQYNIREGSHPIREFGFAKRFFGKMSHIFPDLIFAG